MPSQFLKYFLCSVGKRKFLESYEYLAVALSAWMYNCLAHITMHSEFRLTSQFWRFFLHLDSRNCLVFFSEHHQCGPVTEGPGATADLPRGWNPLGLIFHEPAPCVTTHSCAKCHHCSSAAVSHPFCAGMSDYRGCKPLENSPCVLCSILTEARTSTLMVC